MQNEEPITDAAKRFAELCEQELSRQPVKYGDLLAQTFESLNASTWHSGGDDGQV